MHLSDLLSVKIILASQSPRRLQLLKQMGFEVVTTKIEVEEKAEEGLQDFELAEHLAKTKNHAYTLPIESGSVLVTADTLVFVNGQPLGKPCDKQQAMHYLKILSGREHRVITACTLRSCHQETTFHSVSKVYFRTLSSEEMNYYIDCFQPFDKAGSYGIQEWIGLTGIEKIDGDYYTIMGLPCNKLFSTLGQMKI